MSNCASTINQFGCDFISEFRYENSSCVFCKVQRFPVLISKYFTFERTLLVSSPKQPAFPATAPQTVPGNPIHFWKTESFLSLQICRESTDVSSPLRTLAKFSSIVNPFIVFLITIPLKISNAKITFVPPPIKIMGRPSCIPKEYISVSLWRSECSLSSKKYRAIAGVQKDEKRVISLSISRKRGFIIKKNQYFLLSSLCSCKSTH